MDSEFLTLVESDLSHPTDAVLPTVQVSAEDQEFIDRVFSQVRDVDFRAPPPPPVTLEGADKKIGDLREKVRKLERELARVAYVWSLKHEQMHALDDILTKADATRKDALQTCRRVKEQAIQVVTAYKQQTQAAQSLSQSLGTRKAELELNYQRLSEDHAQMSSRLTEQVGRLERELASRTEEYRQKIESAQNTFQQLREQSAHHLGMLQAQLEGREEENGRQNLEMARLQGVIKEREATLESVRAKYVADHDALRESSAAALEALRSSSAVEYQTLKTRSEAALMEQERAAEAKYESLKQADSAAFADLKASSDASYEALKQNSSAALADLKASSETSDDALRQSSSAALAELKASSDANYEALKTSSVASYEALRESGQSALESMRAGSAAVQEDLSKRLADVEKAEAVARTRIAGLEERLRDKDASLNQSEHRFEDMERKHQQRTTTLEATLEQLKENTALDQNTLKTQLLESQKEAAASQARVTALEIQAQSRDESVRSVAERLTERERTTAQLIDEIGNMRVEQERRLAEKGEALRAAYDELARLQAGLATTQTELAQTKSLHDAVAQERDAFKKLVPPDAMP